MFDPLRITSLSLNGLSRGLDALILFSRNPIDLVPSDEIACNPAVASPALIETNRCSSLSIKARVGLDAVAFLQHVAHQFGDLVDFDHDRYALALRVLVDLHFDRRFHDHFVHRPFLQQSRGFVKPERRAARQSVSFVSVAVIHHHVFVGAQIFESRALGPLPIGKRFIVETCMLPLGPILGTPSADTVPKKQGAFMLFISALLMSSRHVIELIGTSDESWEKAAAAAVKRAAQSLRELRIADVIEQDLQIQDGRVVAYQTKLKLSFKYEDDD